MRKLPPSLRVGFSIPGVYIVPTMFGDSSFTGPVHMDSVVESESNDAVLVPFLKERDLTRSERLLEELLSHHAIPVLRNVVKNKLRVPLNESDGSPENQDALEVFSDAQVKLLVELQSLKASVQGRAIRNFKSYVATLAYHSCYEHFRRKFPLRHSLKNKVRYVVSHDPKFSSWQDDDGDWSCGLAESSARGLSGKGAGPSSGRGEVPDRVLSTLSGSNASSLPLRELVFRILKETKAPVALDSVVNSAAVILGINERNQQADSEEDGPAGALESLSDGRRGVDHQLDQRLYMERLWSEICELPVRQRTALLLNLKDPEGRGVISLLPLTGVASIRHIAAALEMPAERFAELWNDLPLDDLTIANLLGITRQQVINLRKSARERLARKMKGF